MKQGTKVNIGTDEIFDDYRYSNIEILIFDEFTENPINLHQSFRLGKGGIFWDSSFVMAKYIQNIDFNHKTILELGAGTALPSLLALNRGGTVVATDIQPVLNLTLKNFEENASFTQRSWYVHELDWTNPEHRQNISNFSFDYIFMSDVCYLPVIYN